jgi:hypothetical protein
VADAIVDDRNPSHCVEQGPDCGREQCHDQTVVNPNQCPKLLEFGGNVAGFTGDGSINMLYIMSRFFALSSAPFCLFFEMPPGPSQHRILLFNYEVARP